MRSLSLLIITSHYQNHKFMPKFGITTLISLLTLELNKKNATACSSAFWRWTVTTWLSLVTAKYLPEVTWRNRHCCPHPMNPPAHLEIMFNYDSYTIILKDTLLVCYHYTITVHPGYTAPLQWRSLTNHHISARPHSTITIVSMLI